MGFIDELKSTVGLGPEREAEVSWRDRLAEAAYTPPSGLRITFDFVDVGHSFDKKTSVWTFAGAEGALVQDQGVGQRVFPLRLNFSGKDHDLKASVFEQALMERGPGLLEHPMYGTHDVVPFGTISRRDDLVTAANQTVFEVEFFKTLGVAYPLSQDDPASAVLAALDAFGDASSAEFAAAVDIGSASEEKGFLDSVNDTVNAVGDQLGKVAAVQTVVADQMQDITDTINNIITTGVADPLLIAFETRRLIQTPARALASIGARLEGYRNLATDITTAPDAVSAPGGPAGLGPRIDSRTGVGNDAQSPNEFRVRDLRLMSAVSGSVLSTLYTTTRGTSAATIPDVNRQRADAAKTGVTAAGNGFDTAAQALTAAAELLDQLDTVTAWRDENFKSISGGNLDPAAQADFISAISNVDTGEAFQQLQNAVSLGAGFLVQISYNLKRERRIVLDRARSIIDLTAELYNASPDEHIDELITANDLTADEIRELPRGREIVYYV